MKKYFFICFSILIFYSCSNVIILYDTNSLSVPEHFKNEILKKYDAEKVNNSLIYFTDNFSKDTITVSNIKEQIFNNDVSTIESVGLARVIRIDNNLKTKIFNKKDKFYFIIPSNKYKFIYINKLRDNNKYKVVYSNILHGFM